MYSAGRNSLILTLQKEFIQDLSGKSDFPFFDFKIKFYLSIIRIFYIFTDMDSNLSGFFKLCSIFNFEFELYTSKFQIVVY